MTKSPLREERVYLSHGIQSIIMVSKVDILNVEAWGAQPEEEEPMGECSSLACSLGLAQPLF